MIFGAYIISIRGSHGTTETPAMQRRASLEHVDLRTSITHGIMYDQTLQSSSQQQKKAVSHYIQHVKTPTRLQQREVSSQISYHHNNNHPHNPHHHPPPNSPPHTPSLTLIPIPLRTIPRLRRPRIKALKHRLALRVLAKRILQAPSHQVRRVRETVLEARVWPVCRYRVDVSVAAGVEDGRVRAADGDSTG